MARILLFFLSSTLLVSFSGYSQKTIETINYAGGDVYEGQIENGLPNGIGKMTWISGSSYIGSWRNNFQNGHGTMIWETGDEYEGEGVMGVQNGNGKMTWKSQPM